MVFLLDVQVILIVLTQENGGNMGNRKIYVGEVPIDDISIGTPIYMANLAVELAEKEGFIVYTNDPQFVEMLEVLLGEDNINIYLQLNGKTIEITFKQAYDYLGDIYDTINEIRFTTELCHNYKYGIERKDNVIESLKEYEKKWSDFCERNI